MVIEVAVLRVMGGVLQLVTLPDRGGSNAGELPSAAAESGSSLEDLAKTIATRTAAPIAHLEQLAAFDRRRGTGGAIAVTYLAVVVGGNNEATWMDVDTTRLDDLPLSPDHTAVVAAAIDRLRREVDEIAFAFLPDEFTVLDLQRVHEAILGTELRKDTFRRRILTSPLLDPTGRRQQGVSHRPAELYRLRRA